MSYDVDEPITLGEYDPTWPAQFIAEKQRLFGPGTGTGTGVVVEHIGSTAVPGLVAKPIIDILLGVTSPRPDHPLVAHLGAHGYQDLGEAGVPGRRYFRRRLTRRAFNVHMVARDGQLWRDNVLLREYLRAHPAEARSYGEVKRRTAQAAPGSLLEYSAFKAEHVRALLDRARAAGA